MVNLGLFSEIKPVMSVNVRFRIPYYTQWGQSLVVCGSEPVLGSGNVKKGLLLTAFHEGDELIWGGSLTVPVGFKGEYNYYVVDDAKNVLRWEVGNKRKLVLPDGVENGKVVELHDLWQTGSDSLPFTNAFKDVIFRKSSSLAIEKPLGVVQNKLETDDSVIVQFKICCPNIAEGTSLYVIGSSVELGKWKVQDGLKLSYAGDSVWQGDCLVPKGAFPLKYKYCKYGKNGNFSLENGSNREVTIDVSASGPNYLVLSDGMMREMPWRGAGVAIPMFSVRSEEDVGVGEFLDLKLVVDWAVDSGFHLLQLLPINDTSVHKMWWDSYPYSSLSVFALHPLYLRLQALSENIPDDINQEIQKAKKELDGKAVDYDATMATKLSIAKKIFDLEKDLILNSTSFSKFMSENEEWLKPYAAFCFLRDFFETSDHSQWGTFSKFSNDKLEKLISKDSLHYDIIRFHYYIQYHLHIQLSESAEYAKEKGVVLKGDLPIGVDRNSVDCWVNPTLFRMNTSTGAPPDYFDKNGQNWGFPTYNWEEMSKDNYGWWRARLSQQEIQKAKKELDGKAVDYDATMATKLSIAKKIFDLEKDLILNSTSFIKFMSENEEWLKPYAAFCFLRDFFETSDHSQWGTFSKFSNDKLEKLISKDSLHYDIICFHYYIQYHLHIQLSESAEYAKEKGVVLKGDLPIGVDRNSVDCWVNPTLFRMNTSTGAPPDYFDKNGQNWGFPTYNWEEMSKDNYGWWRARLSQMANYFTAYRIDHILGFFRIWELPEHAMTGLVGKFRPSIPLSQEELEKEGIWDFDRLSKPYILQEHLQEIFGPSWIVVASHFMNESEKNRYQFKDDCNTEKKIAAKLKSLIEKSLLLESEDKLRRGLFDLVQNIVLIRDPEDARSFYPRFNLEDTSSFKDLDDNSKNVLRRLYYDYYFQRQETLWRQNAMKTLPALLNSSDMLACGEDLGMIPSCVHPVMQELGLIGLRIQRMPSEADLEFGIPSQYGYMTVCAPSCHDCSTLRAWWEEDEDRRRSFFKTMVGSDSLPPKECIPEIARFVLRQHVEAPSMWAIFPLQDLLALKEEYTTRPAAEETINDPTNPKHYWRFRVHVTIESLLKDKELTTEIKGLVRSSARSYPGQEETQPAGVTNLSATPEKQQTANVQDKIRLPSQNPKVTSIAVL
ncbi:disproportionating enzyme 2 [Artemisia annua]|uniref:4-alpha-glucanotransferase n=1 Tax=Artemisia annua TaxID=35608 RepID=A0A2U1PX22_ARTAN|nr:disproportionating enzyme 2 [Artemisia annua]